MIFWLVAAVVAILAAFASIILYSRKRTDERQKAVALIEAKLDRARAGDEKAIMWAYNVRQNYKQCCTYGIHASVFFLAYQDGRKVNDEQKRAIALTMDYVNHKAKVRQAFEFWQEAQMDGDMRVQDRLSVLLGFLQAINACKPENTERLYAELGTSYEYLRPELNGLIEAHYNELLVIARDTNTNSADAFVAFCILMRDLTTHKNYGSSRFYDLDDLVMLTEPADWNNLVARYVVSPKVDEFVDLPRIDAGELRLAAIEALKQCDLTMVKMVLAISNKHRDICAQLGCQLTLKLGQFANAKTPHYAVAST